MCNFTHTKFSCGCEHEQNTSVCGWVNDDMSECMNGSKSIDVLESRSCGKNECKSKGPAIRPKSLNLGLQRTNSDSGDDWAEDSVTSAEL